jgi:hypothetical protein
MSLLLLLCLKFIYYAEISGLLTSAKGTRLQSLVAVEMRVHPQCLDRKTELVVWIRNHTTVSTVSKDSPILIKHPLNALLQPLSILLLSCKQQLKSATP